MKILICVGSIENLIRNSDVKDLKVIDVRKPVDLLGLNIVQVLEPFDKSDFNSVEEYEDFKLGISGRIFSRLGV